jgi:hypothetical protein
MVLPALPPACVHDACAAACRYLLKLRAEVEVMQQLGLSLNAVHLHDVFEVRTARGVLRE